MGVPTMLTFSNPLQIYALQKQPDTGHRKNVLHNILQEVLRKSTVFIQPCAGVWACRLAGEFLFKGVIICRFDQGSSDTSVPDGSWYVCMDYVHYSTPYDICKVGGMPVDSNFEAPKVLIVLDPCFHDTQYYRGRNSRPTSMRMFKRSAAICEGIRRRTNQGRRVSGSRPEMCAKGSHR